MKPIVAIVGRPNVGKSTLFNRLLGRRKAIATGEPGVTRDLIFADVTVDRRTFTIVDTGGFEPEAKTGIMKQVRDQARLAIEEADIIVFLMDGRTGPAPQDRELVGMLRKVNKPVIYVVNKIDSPRQEAESSDFYTLGIEGFIPLSAEHGIGINDLVDAVIEYLPEVKVEEPYEDMTKVAIVGRPNVGKSSLVNRLLEKERVIVSVEPGTTRDAVDTPFELDGRRYLLIDTAGMRKKSRVTRTLEAYSVMGAVRSIERADVVLLVLDGKEGIRGQDEKIAGLIEKRLKNCIFIVNKWDIVEKDTKTIKTFTELIHSSIPGLPYAPALFVSALTGKNTRKVLDLIDSVHEQSRTTIPTSRLNKVLATITTRHRPPVARGKEVKFYYITQKGTCPPSFVVFCNYPSSVPDSYRRYLVNSLREALNIPNVPVRVALRKRH